MQAQVSTSPLMSALAQAAQALRQGRSDQTVALLDPWMDGSSSDHPELLQLMGVARMRLGRLEPAQACLERRLVEPARRAATPGGADAAPGQRMRPPKRLPAPKMPCSTLSH